MISSQQYKQQGDNQQKRQTEKGGSERWNKLSSKAEMEAKSPLVVHTFSGVLDPLVVLF
jgi:hypothetical protein